MATYELLKQEGRARLSEPDGFSRHAAAAVRGDTAGRAQRQQSGHAGPPGQGKARRRQHIAPGDPAHSVPSPSASPPIIHAGAEKVQRQPRLDTVSTGLNHEISESAPVPTVRSG